MFAFEGVDVIVNSLDDLPELSETVKSEIQGRFIARISHHYLIKAVAISITGVLVIILAVLSLIFS